MGGQEPCTHVCSQADGRVREGTCDNVGVVSLRRHKVKETNPLLGSGMSQGDPRVPVG
jgi:hypothetical protein